MNNETREQWAERTAERVADAAMARIGPELDRLYAIEAAARALVHATGEPGVTGLRLAVRWRALEDAVQAQIDAAGSGGLATQRKEAQ